MCYGISSLLTHETKDLVVPEKGKLPWEDLREGGGLYGHKTSMIMKYLMHAAMANSQPYIFTWLVQQAAALHVALTLRHKAS